MLSFISLATSLYKKVQGAAPDVRKTIMGAIYDARDSGLVPLGMRGGEYVWLLFERRTLSAPARDAHIKARTPVGVTVRIVEI